MQQNYIGGRWRPTGSTDASESRNPATGEPVALVPESTADDIDAAVAAARAALPGWAALPAGRRAGYLRRLRDRLLAERARFDAAISTEMGAPIRFAHRVQTGLPLLTLGAFLDALPGVVEPETIGHSLIARDPVGVVAAITPWNYPLHQIVAKVAAALAVGATVVLKPSERAPLSAAMLAGALDEIGLPPGVLNMVVGRGPSVGAMLAAHPDVDMVSFTGSTAAGRRVAETAGRAVKRVALELGGKSATVILPDADLPAALAHGVANCLMNSGQTCTALARMLVPRDLYGRVLAEAADLMAGYRIGPPTDPATRLGPLISAEARGRVLDQIAVARTAGVEVRDGSGGQRLPDRGYFTAPVALGVEDPGMAVAQEELFAPVLCVIPYDGEEDALRIANDSRYGLSGAVWSADVARALAFARGMRTGRVDVNGAGFNPAAPFGGRGQSGTGYELGRYGLAEFQVHQSIQLPEAG